MKDVIDISSWQPEIDWDIITSWGITGVIIKLGENKELDSYFESHLNEAMIRGFSIGVYYYAHAENSEEAEQEAAWTIEQLNIYRSGEAVHELGIWYDMEKPSIRSNSTDVTALCSSYIVAMNKAGFDNVGIYANYDWLTNVINTDALASYVPYWVAQYSSVNSFAAEHADKNIKMWQYTDRLNIDGTLFDGNIYYD